MAQTKTGALKQAAHRIGLTVEQYLEKIQSENYCNRCKAWLPKTQFCADKSRSTGLHKNCNQCRSAANKARYTPKPRPKPGRYFVAPRDGDEKQARRRVNYLVESGLIPHPNSLPCAECGHMYVEGERRHEYDHYLGYAAEHHEKVKALCTTCHFKSDELRRSQNFQSPKKQQNGKNY